MKNLLPIICFTLCFSILSGQTPFTVTPSNCFQDSFDNGSFKPAWDPQASFIGAGGVVSVVSGAGINGTYGVGIGKSYDDANPTTNTLDLYLDLSDPSLVNIELTFWIADRQDEWQFGEGIWFSDDGIDFKQVLDFYGGEWCDFFYGQHPPIDVDKIVADDDELELTENFVIRFRQTGQYDFEIGNGQYDGFYLDNVKVCDPGLVYYDISPLPFADDFGDNKLEPWWAWNFADETATIATGSAITSPMSFVGAVNQAGWDMTPGVFMGRICDGVFTTNALDLHLNLEGETEVEMTFFIANHQDETHDDDGIYFSDDGGIEFKKVLDFTPSEWCDGVWGQYPPIDIDELAASPDMPLQLTDKFVVRFQQTGQYDYDPGNGQYDGFFLDNVNVYDPDLIYTSLPVEDDFNDNKLPPWWAWNFADSTALMVTGGAVTNPMGFAGAINQVVLLGRRCDGNTLTMNALDLHLDLLGKSDVEMTFWIADQRDETHEDDGIYFSEDGGKNFKKVLNFSPSQWCDGVWGQHPPIDVDGLAADSNLSLSSQFVIRFQQAGQYDFDAGNGLDDGFYLDDVHVYDPNLEYACLPFEDNFEIGTFKPSWAWNFADETATIISDDSITSPMSRVEVTNEYGGYNSIYAAVMGKRCDGTFTTNALDLHLNLLGQTDVDLSFYLADIAETTHEDDGIYFSDDGGENFKKVYIFDFEAVNGYQLYKLPVDSLCESVMPEALELTDKFVIRFQQRGEHDFGLGNGLYDGFYLDNVKVTGTDTCLISAATIYENQEVVKVFPNPTSSTITVIVEGNLTRINQVEVININGNAMLNKKANLGEASLNLDTYELPPGLYIISITLDNGEKINRKLIKE